MIMNHWSIMKIVDNQSWWSGGGASEDLEDVDLAEFGEETEADPRRVHDENRPGSGEQSRRLKWLRTQCVMFAIFDINIKTLAQTLSATKSAENLSAPGHQVENKKSATKWRKSCNSYTPLISTSIIIAILEL